MRVSSASSQSIAVHLGPWWRCKPGSTGPPGDADSCRGNRSDRDIGFRFSSQTPEAINQSKLNCFRGRAAGGEAVAEYLSLGSDARDDGASVRVDDGPDGQDLSVDHAGRLDALTAALLGSGLRRLVFVSLESPEWHHFVQRQRH